MSLVSSSIRRRITVLVAVPIVAVLTFAVITIVGRVGHAQRAAGTARAMTVATQVGSVLTGLETEELVSVGYLVGTQTAADVDAQASQVADRIADVEANLGDRLPARVRTAIAGDATLSDLRHGVTARTAAPSTVITTFTSAIDSIIDALSLPAAADPSSAAGRQILALDDLMRIDALHAAGAANLLVAAVQHSESSIVAYAGAQRAAAGLESGFLAYASPAQKSRYDLVTNAYIERVGTAFVSAFAKSPSTAVATVSPRALFPQLVSYAQLGTLVEAKITADVTTVTNRAKRTSVIQAYVVGGVALLVVLLAILASWVVVRSVRRTLGGLAVAAGDAADHSAAQLRRVAADQTEAADHVPMDALPVAARTEAGDLARVFVRAQRCATEIVERQAAARRNVAQMTGSASRRGANLVARQISIIARLERVETDPEARDALRRLDHVTSRLRRVAASLVTLSEGVDAGRHAVDETGYLTPMALADVLQLASDEIENEGRVDAFVPANTMVEPAVIDDIVLLFAELIANGVAFSPSGTRVRVVARPYDHAVTIVDEGVGISAEQLVTINDRLADVERPEFASTGALGLFVVGRIARRHDLRVTFEHTPGGGATVVVDLGHHVDTVTPAETVRATATVLATGTIPRPRDGEGDLVAAVATRRFTGPMMELDSRPFNLERFERAAAVLVTGQTWNAFEVLPARQPALPPGSGAPELPGALAMDTPARRGNGALSYTRVEYPRSDRRRDDGRDRPAGEFSRGNVPSADVGSGDLARGDLGGGDLARGDLVGGDLARDDLAGGDLARGEFRPGDLPRAGNGFAAAGPIPSAGRFGDGPFKPSAAESGRLAASTFGTNPADASPFAAGQAGTGNGGSGPFGGGAVFPAGGVARYVPPDETATRPGLSGLSRRIPGATSPADHTVDVVPAFRTLDPDQARSLVEQFELGVTRALDEAAVDRFDDEGRTQ